MKIKPIWLLVILLVIIILLQRSCKSAPPASQPEVITKIETKYDTIVDSFPVYIPKWKTKVIYKIDTLEKVDTALVLGDYFSKYYYSDTLQKDSLTLIINDTINQNKIFSREVNYKLKYPTVTITKEIYPKKRQLYLGGNLVGNKEGIYYLGPGLIYKDKQDKIYNLGVGFDGGGKTTFNLGVYWKLGKK